MGAMGFEPITRKGLDLQSNALSKFSHTPYGKGWNRTTVNSFSGYCSTTELLCMHNNINRLREDLNLHPTICNRVHLPFMLLSLPKYTINQGGGSWTHINWTQINYVTITPRPRIINPRTGLEPVTPGLEIQCSTN